MVKITVKIDAGEEELRYNVTSFLVSPITLFDNNVENVLTGLSLLGERGLKPRGVKEGPYELMKVRLKMLQLICSATASQTIQEAAKVVSQLVYDQRLQDDYASDNVQEDVWLVMKVPFSLVGSRTSEY